MVVPHRPDMLVNQRWGDIEIVPFRYAPSRLEQLAGEGGILPRLKEKPWRWLLVPGFLASQLLTAYGMIRRHSIRLIHAHWIVPQGLIAMLLKWFCFGQPRTLITAHGADVYGLASPFFRILKKMALGSADRIACVSEAMRQDVLQAFPQFASKLVVAPMGVDIVHGFVPAEKRPGSVIFVGRLVEKKGVGLLLVAFKQVLDQGLSCHLKIVGGGTLAVTLKQQCQDLGIEEHVEFTGPMPQSGVRQELAQSAVCVMPSTTATDGDKEGLGLVAIEALGSGCAVVMSDYSASQEFAVHGENVHLFRQGDASALAEGLALVLRDDDYRESLSANGRKSVIDRYDWSIAGARYSDTLRQLAEDPE